jgi:hypothetical protein
MKSALTHCSFNPGVLSSVPSGSHCILDLGCGTEVFRGALKAEHLERYRARLRLSACASEAGFAGARFLGPVVPLPGGVGLRVAADLLGAQFMLLATPG